MSLLDPRIAQALKTAKLPAGVSRYSIPGSKMPAASQKRIEHWLKISHHPVTDNFDGWWTVQESAEYGRTLWGPYVALSPDSVGACLVHGYTTVCLDVLQNWTVVADEDGGYAVEWCLDAEKDDYVQIPIRLAKDVKTSLAELRKAIKSDASKVLAKATIFYPKLPSLPIGEYQVTGYFEYSGYNGPEYGLEVKFGAGTQRFQGNRVTSEVLNLAPVISEEVPATLTIYGHTTTKQGYPSVRCSLQASFPDVEDADFSFDDEPTQPALLAPAEVVFEVDFEDAAPEGLAAPDPATEDLDPSVTVEPAPKAKTKRSR